MLPHNWTRAARLLFLIAILLQGSSCGIRKKVTTRARAILGADVMLRAHVAPNANLNNPVAVEFVLVYDDKLLETLAKTNARDWFQNREQLRLDFPKGFDSWYWEWVPGQVVDEQKLPLKPKAVAGFVFANYVLAGDNRAKVDPYHSLTINLGERTFTATQE